MTFCVVFFLTQKSQNYVKRKATLFSHAEIAELLESQSDNEIASGRFSVFSGFCVRNNFFFEKMTN